MKLSNDALETTMTFQAPIDRVWRALTNPETMAKWFCTSGVEGSIAPGEQPILAFGEDQCRIQVVAMDEPKHFSYRWIPGSASTEPVTGENTTLVEFSLQPSEEGTLVTLRESGFASLDPAFRAKAVQMNTWGWAECCKSLHKYFEEQGELPDAMWFYPEFKAPIDRVWEILSTERIIEPYGAKSMEGKMAPGELVTFFWEGFTNSMMILEIQDYRVSYAWVPGESHVGPLGDKMTTKVEMLLVPTDKGTRLILQESGFLKFGAEGTPRFAMNYEGWSEEVLGPLQKFFEEVASVSPSA